MTVLYPPVLDSIAKSIPHNGADVSVIGNEEPSLEIYFYLPTMISRNTIKHVQACIKYYHNGASALQSVYTPDTTTMFLDATVDSFNFRCVDTETNLYLCTINYSCFQGGAPISQLDYMVQLRFGSGALWADSKPAVAYTPGDKINNWTSRTGAYNFTNFAPWRKNEINKIPSGFGEWSNIQKVHCYSYMAHFITTDDTDMIPTIKWVFQSDDATEVIEQVSLTYGYQTVIGTALQMNCKQETLITGGSYDLENQQYIATFDLPIAPVTAIECRVRAVTKNNTIVTDEFTMRSLWNNTAFNTKNSIDLIPVTVSGEQVDDGLIAKEIDLNHLRGLNIINYSIYRINLLNFRIIKLYSDLTYLTGSYYRFKDYTVEAGQEYIYCVVGKKLNDNIQYVLSNLRPWSSVNPAYGRLMKIEFPLLTTRYHQLRLEGNLSVSNFRRNVSESFQDTIGSQYPYFSKTGNKNYRTLSVSALISIHFDPTFGFLALDKDVGLIWKDENLEDFICYDTDILDSEQISLSRRRMCDKKNTDNERIDMLEYRDNLVSGPLTIHESHLYKQNFMTISTQPDDNTIFVERKFRERVMSWLSDGKPKLLRSETEGNMIVMVTGVTFSPYERSSRSVYNMSCVLTEIAEYNVENLLKYDLIPTVFETNYIASLTYDFNAGDLDPYVNRIILFKNENNEYCIPATMIWQAITPLQLYNAVQYGSGNYTFSSTNLPAGISLDSTTGRISGVPTNQKTSDTIINVTVTDLQKTDYEGNPLSATMAIPCGVFYQPLKATVTQGNPTGSIPRKIVGHKLKGTDRVKIVHTAGTGYGAVKIQTIGLPVGMSYNTTSKLIVGQYSKTMSADQAIVRLIDQAANILEIVVPYGGADPAITFDDDESFRVDISEVGVAVPEIHFGDKVSGGEAPYTYKLLNAQPGMTINSTTGLFSWTPQSSSISTKGGTFTVKVTDSIGDSVSKVIVYDQVVDKFTFNPPAITDPKMKIGDKLNVPALWNYVKGGLQYDTQPLYRFTAENLAPDFTIDNHGLITGVATKLSPARVAKITVTDKRGKSITKTLNIPEIVNSLVYSNYGIGAVKFGECEIGLPYDGYTYTFNNTSGEVRQGDGHVFSISKDYFEPAPSATNVYTVTPDTSFPFPVTVTQTTTAWLIDIGAPTSVVDANTKYITFTNTTLSQTYQLPVSYGHTYKRMTVQQIATTITGAQFDKEITPTVVARITGGKAFKADEYAVDPATQTFNGLKAQVVYNDKLGCYDLMITGIPKAVVTDAVWTIGVNDRLGDVYTYLDVFIIVTNTLKLYHINGKTFDNKYFIKGKTVIPTFTDAGNLNATKTNGTKSHTFNYSDLICLYATGGTPPYTYYIDTTGGTATGTTFNNGLTLKTLHDSSTGGPYSGKEVGVIQGTPSTIKSAENYAKAFWVKDAAGNTAHCSNASTAWMSVVVTQDIEVVKTPITLNDTYVNQAVGTTQLFRTYANKKNLQGLQTPYDAIFEEHWSWNNNYQQLANIEQYVTSGPHFNKTLTFTLTRHEADEVDGVQKYTPDTVISATVSPGFAVFTPTIKTDTNGTVGYIITNKDVSYDLVANGIVKMPNNRNPVLGDDYQVYGIGKIKWELVDTTAYPLPAGLSLAPVTDNYNNSRDRWMLTGKTTADFTKCEIHVRAYDENNKLSPVIKLTLLGSIKEIKFNYSAADCDIPNIKAGNYGESAKDYKSLIENDNPNPNYKFTVSAPAGAPAIYSKTTFTSDYKLTLSVPLNITGCPYNPRQVDVVIQDRAIINGSSVTVHPMIGYIYQPLKKINDISLKYGQASVYEDLPALLDGCGLPPVTYQDFYSNLNSFNLSLDSNNRLISVAGTTVIKPTANAIAVKYEDGEGSTFNVAVNIADPVIDLNYIYSSGLAIDIDINAYIGNWYTALTKNYLLNDQLVAMGFSLVYVGTAPHLQATLTSVAQRGKGKLTVVSSPTSGTAQINIEIV